MLGSTNHVVFGVRGESTVAQVRTVARSWCHSKYASRQSGYQALSGITHLLVHAERCNIDVRDTNALKTFAQGGTGSLFANHLRNGGLAESSIASVTSFAKVYLEARSEKTSPTYVRRSVLASNRTSSSMFDQDTRTLTYTQRVHPVDSRSLADTINELVAEHETADDSK